MSFHTQHAMEDNNEASVLHFIKTGFRIPGTRLLFDLRTAGVDMDLVKNVTHTTASWVEYAELAVHTDAQLDVPACTFSFCGRPHTLSELEAILVTADELMDRLVDPGWSGCQEDQPAEVRSIQKHQAWVVKDAADMLQQYTKLSSGAELLDFLMHNIEEAERMNIVETKFLAMVVFCAQLEGAAKLYVARFMTGYVGNDNTNDEAESSQADRPEVFAAKQQVAQSYAEYVGKMTQADEGNVPTALPAISEADSNEREEAEGEEAEGEGEEDESEDEEEEDEEDEDGEEEDREEDDEEEEDKEEEDKEEEHLQEEQPADSEADSSSSPDAEEVE
ncbi:hypothetical protein WJX82_004434 [Trebouxia sp. C0006]